MYCTRCGIWAPEGATSCPGCGAPLPAAAAPVAEAAPAPPAAVLAAAVPPAPRSLYGGFWRRLAATFVDSLLFLFPDATARALMGLPSLFSLRPIEDTDQGRLLGLFAAGLAASWLYCALLESSRWQGTLGQQLLGLRVTTLSGRRVSFARATGRFVAQWLSWALCGVGYLFNLWTARRQTLHDLVSGCVLARPAVAEPREAAGLEERLA